jgi:tripeptidyl-peptidase-1
MLSKAAVFVVLAVSLPALAAVHEKLATTPSGWTAVSAPATDTQMTFSIGLKQQNIDQLETKLLAVSTPGSAQYGQHLEMEEVNALFAPSAEATSTVQAWLNEAGIPNQLATDGQFISFSTTVETANKLLNTTFMNFENAGASKIRTTEYSVPDKVSGFIDLIDPTTYFGKTVANRVIPVTAISGTQTTKDLPPSKRAIDASCQTSITPRCLKELYNVGDYVPDPISGSRVGFGTFLNGSTLNTDLTAFETLNNITQQGYTLTLINGGVDDQDPATADVGEANLDVQNIVGVSHPLPITEFITGGSPPFIPNLDESLNTTGNTNEPYIPYYQYLLSQPNSVLPQVISNSYGDDEQTVPESYAIRACNMIGMMGLRGITIIESSGDTGVGAPCQSNDGKKTSQFTPQFPGTCPYILAVGGTVAVTPEIAWSASSGGFSNYFSRPLYQEFAVENYLTNHITPATKRYFTPFTNFAGRGFPDISAHSLSPK